MGRKKELTAIQRGAILYGHQRGDSYRTIAKNVNCGLSTVCDTLKRYAETGSTESKTRAGRPRLFETPQLRQLKRMVIKNRRLCKTGI